MELTEKEKAKELVNKFSEYSNDEYHECSEQFELNENRIKNAKQCALIAVDEILSYDIRAKCESQFIIEQRIESYWKQVKQEINNL